jgi:4-hydroxy-tetrahydrodipicolinate synthase
LRTDAQGGTVHQLLEAHRSKRSKKMDYRIKGVFAAVATPLTPDHAVDTPRLIAQCRRLLDRGCHGLALLGSTGEATSFSQSERKAILETVLASGIAPQTILLGTGLPAIGDTIELTRHALDLGVTDFLVLPPFFYKNLSDDGLVASYRHLIETVADQRLALVLYHIPQFSGIPITHASIEQLRRHYPEIVVGLKDSSGQRESGLAFIENHPGFGVLAGADPLMLPFLRAGGAGAITGLANIASASLRIIYDHADQPAFAEQVQAAQTYIEALRAISTAYPPMAAIKTITAALLDDPTWRRMRPPLSALNEADYHAILQKLAESPVCPD